MAYTKQNTRVERVQMDIAFDAAGAATAVKVNAFIQNRRVVNDADPTDAVAQPWKQVDFDLLDAARASDVITAAGKTVSPVQLAALIRQYSLDRANAAGIS